MEENKAYESPLQMIEDSDPNTSELGPNQFHLPQISPRTVASTKSRTLKKNKSTSLMGYGSMASS